VKFFTPDLLLRFGSEDTATANAAQDEWEIQNGNYLKRLREIRSALPRSVRTFISQFCLHDAKLLILGLRHDLRMLSLFLELDDAEETGLQLIYDLVRKPELLKHPELAEKGTPMEWLYDEFDVKKKGGRRVFTHSILLTGGRELRLSFHKLHLMPYKKMVVQEEGGDLDSLYETIGA
jgi:hypothetical protein